MVGLIKLFKKYSDDCRQLEVHVNDATIEKIYRRLVPLGKKFYLHTSVSDRVLATWCSIFFRNNGSFQYVYTLTDDDIERSIRKGGSDRARADVLLLEVYSNDVIRLHQKNQKLVENVLQVNLRWTPVHACWKARGGPSPLREFGGEGKKEEKKQEEKKQEESKQEDKKEEEKEAEKDDKKEEEKAEEDEKEEETKPAEPVAPKRNDGEARSSTTSKQGSSAKACSRCSPKAAASRAPSRLTRSNLASMPALIPDDSISALSSWTASQGRSGPDAARLSALLLNAFPTSPAYSSSSRGSQQPPRPSSSSKGDVSSNTTPSGPEEDRPELVIDKKGRFVAVLCDELEHQQEFPDACRTCAPRQCDCKWCTKDGCGRCGDVLIVDARVTMHIPKRK
ncbi:uncharacterized protein K489DRAFT_371665 [Dissoconium aciculare CBS 342.82]|uniref:Uncharacterized protein n=1 Tax=Dissoconium aciculare CBS 342.82 TaxID=1314786 RepID=A0A6J3M437_9PEZI|nr:uncharacterized protein K489DRAFT_371665 [Dissoconium aciculare CBS 342.82]KAF1821682.1 hypothetical protein K489DRAFT_371665 [Dissoconium aciculare CBS 342.82]